MFQSDKERVHDQRNIDRSLVFTSACLNIRMDGWEIIPALFHHTVMIEGEGKVRDQYQHRATLGGDQKQDNFKA